MNELQVVQVRTNRGGNMTPDLSAVLACMLIALFVGWLAEITCEAHQ